MHGILLVDKPRGWTSHDVVAWVRSRLGLRSVGHGGTLDPAAEGLLLILVGVATRLAQYAIDADKSYIAHIVLGVSTTTDDLEGEPRESQPVVSPPSRAAIAEILERFRGTIQQVPPAYSAIKVAGTAAYRRIRRGDRVALEPRTVTVHRLELLHYDYPDLVVAIDCGKGFYVRALARDLGDTLGTGGYLHGLVRTRIGRFHLNQAWTITDLERTLGPETWPLLAQHPDALVQELPPLVLPNAQLTAWYHGAPVRCSVTASEGSLARAYAADGDWIGLARYDALRKHWHPELVHRARC